MAKYNSNSPYFSTKSTSWYLMPLQWRAIPKDISDKYYIVKPEWEGKPIVMADAIYGNAGYWWIISVCNMDLIRDPNVDLVSGMTIRLPTKDRLVSILG